MAVTVALVVYMEKEESRGDPAFPYSTNYNYYAGSSHLQQFPYYDCSMPVDCSSWPPYHGPGYYSTPAEPVSDAYSSSDSDEDNVQVQVSWHI